MSWCRWGSPCSFTIPPNEGCDLNPCPGSDLYIYESTEGGIVCCACRLKKDDTDFIAQTEEEMERHCRDHVTAGHHVRPGLYDHEFQERQAANRRADIEKHGEWGAIKRWALQSSRVSDAHAEASYESFRDFFARVGADIVAEARAKK